MTTTTQKKSNKTIAHEALVELTDGYSADRLSGWIGSPSNPDDVKSAQTAIDVARMTNPTDAQLINSLDDIIGGCGESDIQERTQQTDEEVEAVLAFMRQS